MNKFLEVIAFFYFIELEVTFCVFTARSISNVCESNKKKPKTVNVG